MGQEPRFLGCFARSRSTSFSDAAVLVKNKDARVSTGFDPASTPDWLRESGQVT